MTKKIPIKAAKDFAKQFGLEHLIIFAHSGDKLHHVVTYGKTKLGCSQAADFGNRLKEALGWPESLQGQPARVRKLEARVKELEAAIKEYQTNPEDVRLPSTVEMSKRTVKAKVRLTHKGRAEPNIRHEGD